MTVCYELSEEQQLLRREVRRFAEDKIRPGVTERDRSHQLPCDLLQEMGELGLLGMMVDPAFGGGGADTLSYVVAVEEIARVCPSIAVTMSVTNSVCCWPIATYGDEDLKQRVLPELASGKCLGAFGLTESGSGSDVASLATRAVREGSEWIINGEKAWITNAGLAGYYVLMAKTDPAGGNRGISAFVVPADAAGVQCGAPEEKLGLKASQTAALTLEDCRIPVANLLGNEGEGFKIALATLDHSRLGIAAQAVGIHQRALELAIEYARERVQFGVAIAQHQAIRFKLAQMATELEAARLLTWAAAVAPPGRAARLASQAKLYASEAANRACYDSLQIHGGNGFSEDYEIARLYRDVRVTTIYEGTSEMQRLVIARRLLRANRG
jgi:alkylation response protein AidB-like acyl-CoA dehydrogenase